MTDAHRAPTRTVPGSRPAEPKRRPAARPAKAAMLGPVLVWGGVAGLAGCLALILSASPRHETARPQVVLAAKAPAPRAPAFRVQSAPDRRETAPAAEAARMPSPALQAALPAVRAMPMAAKAKAAASHRFAPASVETAAAFLPVAPAPAEPVVRTASAPPAEAKPQRLAMAMQKAASRAAPSMKREAAGPMPVEDHVETALPDTDAVPAAPPTSARAALEREIALAVPKPSTRPVRDGGATPVLGKRHRAPAGLLAYARPDAGADADEPPLLDRAPPPPKLGAGTAIYDIAAATVYLPTGEKLEAHSGLGRMRDDVRYAHEKNRGPAPPHTYHLSMRESLFHGVAAIRLTPIGGERKIHNRNGLLAHTYMLGPRGDSNGCVSFKDYKRFLAAFRRGDFKRLVVVASLDSPTSRLTSWFGKSRK